MNIIDILPSKMTPYHKYIQRLLGAILKVILIVLPSILSIILISIIYGIKLYITFNFSKINHLINYMKK